MKKTLSLCCLLSAGILFSASASAWDGWDDSRHRRHHAHGKHKQEYWDGACKVKRKWKGNGEYKEERKCKPAYHGHRQGPAYSVYPQITVPAIPGIIIQGTAVIR